MEKIKSANNVSYYRNFRIEETESGYVIYWDYAKNIFRRSRNLCFLLELADEMAEKTTMGKGMETVISKLKQMPVSRTSEKVFGDYNVRKHTSKTYILYRKFDGEYLGSFVGAERVARMICKTE